MSDGAMIPPGAIPLLFASFAGLAAALTLLWLSRRKATAPVGAKLERSTVGVPARAEGVIRIVNGIRGGEDVSITDQIIVGRDPARANLVIPDPKQFVSGIHCEIGFDPAQQVFTVRDLQSRNGTILVAGRAGDTRRISAETAETIAPGVELMLGTEHNRIRLELS